MDKGAATEITLGIDEVGKHVAATTKPTGSDDAVEEQLEDGTAGTRHTSHSSRFGGSELSSAQPGSQTKELWDMPDRLLETVLQIPDLLWPALNQACPSSSGSTARR